MPFDPLGDLANLLGMPEWFTSGIIGLVAMFVILVIVIKLLEARGIMLSVVVLGVMFMNIAIFSWPFWPVVIVGIGMLWQLGKEPAIVFPSFIRIRFLKPDEPREP